MEILEELRWENNFTLAGSVSQICLFESMIKLREHDELTINGCSCNDLP